MKKLLFLFAALVVIGITSAFIAGEHQTRTLSAYNGQWVSKSLDTLVNADTSYLVFNSVTGAYDPHFVATVTKISGTVGGAIALFGTDDLSTPTSASLDTLANVVAGPTASNYNNYATVANATGTYEWFYTGITAYKYKWYILRYISSGTQTSSFAGKAYFRKP